MQHNARIRQSVKPWRLGVGNYLCFCSVNVIRTHGAFYGGDSRHRHEKITYTSIRCVFLLTSLQRWPIYVHMKTKRIAAGMYRTLDGKYEIRRRVIDGCAGMPSETSWAVYDLSIESDFGGCWVDSAPTKKDALFLLEGLTSTVS